MLFFSSILLTEVQPTFFSSPRNVENIDFNKLGESTLQNGFLEYKPSKIKALAEFYG